MPHDLEQLEFLLSQRADGTLSAEEHRVIESALASDATLQVLATRYDQLGGLLARYRAGEITIDSAVLTDALRDAVRTELQFQLSQELDGELPATASTRLDRVLASNLAAQRDEQGLHSIHRLLGAYADATCAPELPGLSNRISAAVRGETLAEPADASLAGVDKLLTTYSLATASPQMPDLAGRISAAIRREPVASKRRTEAAPAQTFAFAKYARRAALAAAIGLAVMVARPLWLRVNNSGNAPAPYAQVAQIAVQLSYPHSSGVVEVHFDQTEPTEEQLADMTTSGPSFISRTHSTRTEPDNTATARAAVLLLP